jgi:coenzyme F420-0:L-glutamate ligase/coenzyme F420-1:gamma-L-glutamate ligase
VKDRAALKVTAVPWPEVEAGADLTALVLASTTLQDGDVLVLTSKVVSKSEGRSRPAERAAVVAAETRRVVARRGSLVIAETAHGLVMAAAGVDSSNTPPGTSITLPADPDRTARRLREQLLDRAGRNVAVVVSDTVGRAWRTGQTDLAIGCAGMDALESLQGELDDYGNELHVTAPAIADEVAAAGDLVKGKRTGCPLAVVRGLGDRVLPPGRHGDGAAALVRAAPEDLFALGTREAVLAAVLREDAGALAHFPLLTPDERPPFDRIATPAGVAIRVEGDSRAAGATSRGWHVTVTVEAAAAAPALWLAAGRVVEQVHAVAAAHRLERTPPESEPTTRSNMAVVDSALWSTS